ncbi:uncharacterized protein LOC100570016 [Acyrthosiphon pisum]|uniref:Uncharacterized protein n=1 Tax=Acyrthosiphon pisum TaxID=7029 RepID=A0A8R2NK61_ACYPI|nr:uncharacterized protein LOC100570016 [Acyrthosiphon pisum]
MTSMKNFTQVEVTGDADAVTSELYVENTIENPAWYTVEDNHVSLVSENIEKVIKLETDVLDDCIWESRIEITKYADNQSNMELPLESQVISFLNNTFLLYAVYRFKSPSIVPTLLFFTSQIKYFTTFNLIILLAILINL